MKYLNEILSEAATEEEVKFLFAKFFKLKPDTKNFIDLYTPQILFEFKFDSPLKNIQTRAKIVSQTLYYVRRLKFGRDYRPVSQNICIVTKNSAAVFTTETRSKFFRIIGGELVEKSIKPENFAVFISNRHLDGLAHQ